MAEMQRQLQFALIMRHEPTTIVSGAKARHNGPPRTTDRRLLGAPRRRFGEVL